MEFPCDEKKYSQCLDKIYRVSQKEVSITIFDSDLLSTSIRDVSISLYPVDLYVLFNIYNLLSLLV